MRKPTKFGYCTTCNRKIFIFDTNGRPFKRRSNYCEVLLDLSNGSRGKLAFCKDCISKGIDAEEAIMNAYDGVAEDLKKKNWSPKFKEFHLEQYEGLKIREVIQIKKWDRDKQIFKDFDEAGQPKNLFDGPQLKTKKYTAQQLKEVIHAYSNQAGNSL